MTNSNWLTELREWTERQAGDDDPAEQVALSAQELLGGVSDAEVLDAYSDTDGTGLLDEVLLAAIQTRGLDL